MMDTKADAPGPAAAPFAIRDTPYGGRGAFATQDLAQGTLVLACSAPYASTPFRSFRKEVCAWCFSYSLQHSRRGWDVKLSSDSGGRGSSAAASLVFCGAVCRERWVVEYQGPHADGVTLWFELHALLDRTVAQEAVAAARAKGRPAPAAALSAPAAALVAHLETLEEGPSGSVAADAVSAAWDLADAAFARGKGILPTLRTWSHGLPECAGAGLLTEFEADCTRFVLDGLLRRALELARERDGLAPACAGADAVVDGAETIADGVDAIVAGAEAITAGADTIAVDTNAIAADAYDTGPGTWADLLQLQDNENNNVRANSSILATFVRVYGILRYLVTSAAAASAKAVKDPHGDSSARSASPLLAHLGELLADTHAARAIIARYYSNVFGIWEETGPAAPVGSGGGGDGNDGGDGNGDILGWALFVPMSYFNHDCSPNIKKRRVGRGIQFHTTRAVRAGAELCTSYIDVGPERGVEDRNAELERGWFFTCRCARCCLERAAAASASAAAPVEAEAKL